MGVGAVSLGTGGANGERKRLPCMKRIPPDLDPDTGPSSTTRETLFANKKEGEVLSEKLEKRVHAWQGGASKKRRGGMHPGGMMGGRGKRAKANRDGRKIINLSCGGMDSGLFGGQGGSASRLHSRKCKPRGNVC